MAETGLKDAFDVLSSHEAIGLYPLVKQAEHKVVSMANFDGHLPSTNFDEAAGGRLFGDRC